MDVHLHFCFGCWDFLGQQSLSLLPALQGQGEGRDTAELHLSRWVQRKEKPFVTSPGDSWFGFNWRFSPRHSVWVTLLLSLTRSSLSPNLPHSPHWLNSKQWQRISVLNLTDFSHDNYQSFRNQNPSSRSTGADGWEQLCWQWGLSPPEHSRNSSHFDADLITNAFQDRRSWVYF